jgi:hypothetical protein
MARTPFAATLVLTLLSTSSLASARPASSGSADEATSWVYSGAVAGALDRAAEALGRRYALDAAQLATTRELLHTHAQTWMAANQGALEDIGRRVLEAAVAAEPPTADEVAAWSRDVLPLLEDLSAAVDTLHTELEPLLNADQQAQLAADKLTVQSVGQVVGGRLTDWTEGGFDPEYDWPAVRAQASAAVTGALRAAAEVRKKEAEATAPDESASAAADPAKAKNSGPADPWAVYVEEFIARYHLTGAAETKARELLRRAQTRRARYLDSKSAAIRKLEESLRAADTESARRAAAHEHETLTRPVDQMFERLKSDLARLAPETRSGEGKAPL